MFARPTSAIRRWLRAIAVTLFTVIASQAHAQIVIDVPGRADIPIAVPRSQTPNGDPRRSVDEAWQTLIADLKLSGYFLVIDPAAYIEKDAGVEPNTFDWGAWAPLRTAVLVKTRLLPPGQPECDPAGQATCLDVFVYVAAGNQLLAKTRLRSATDSARYLGHRAADVVIEAVTGQKGIFGSRIAAVSSQGGNKELMFVDIDGKGAVPVTRNGSINLSPSISPDGSAVAWTSYKKGNPDIYVKELGTGRTRVISNKLGINVSPSWSPDGRTIAVARSGEADSDIVVLDARTGALVKQVTTGGGIDVSPHFSPDGQRLAFATERSGGSQIYVADLGSGTLTRVTHTGDFNIDPVYSPDGSEIAFVSREAGGFDIYVVSSDGRNIRRITQDTGDNEDPSWSPDGRYLVFSSTRNGRSEIWLSTADGRHQMPVTRTGGWTQPTLGPVRRPMARAAIDIGSNSILLTIVDASGALLHDEARVVGLGQGLGDRGLFRPDRIAAAEQAIEHFLAVARKHGVEPWQIKAVATSAARRAMNAETWIARLMSRTGLRVRVIPGDEEARLTWLGALRDLEVPDGPVLVVDLGGGSTELVLGVGADIHARASVELGSARLTEDFLGAGAIPDPAGVAKLRNHVDMVLGSVRLEPKPRTVVAVAGTATTLMATRLGLAQYDRAAVHGGQLTRADLAGFVDRLLTATADERRALFAVSPERADFMLAGVIVLDRVLVAARRQALRVSDRGLRFGLLA